LAISPARQRDFDHELALAAASATPRPEVPRDLAVRTADRQHCDLGQFMTSTGAVGEAARAITTADIREAGATSLDSADSRFWISAR